MSRLLLLASLFAAILLPTMSPLTPVAPAGAEEIPMKEYLVRLLGTRPGWPEDATEEETRIMEEHYRYLRDLVAQGKVLMAGPCFGLELGLVILRTASEEEAREIMENEPSVMQGVHTYDLNELRVSLMADHTRPDRYAVDPTGRTVHKEVVVPASLEEVWRAWTTTEGVETFFSSNAHVELRVGGPYEIYFIDSAPYGQKGSEGCRILSYKPMEMLSFEWNAPPSFGDLRGIHTWVVLRFDEVGEGKVRVRLDHLGWGEGERWDGLAGYFEKAWGYVLGSLERRFQEGPTEWNEG